MTSFTEMQVAFGKPLYPLGAGIAPRARMKVSSRASKSPVLVPALTKGRMYSKHSPARRQLRSMARICLGVLMIMPMLVL